MYLFFSVSRDGPVSTSNLNWKNSLFFLPTQTYEITEKELIIDKIMYNVGNFSKRTPKSNINVSFKVI